jgi:hypothetical protein
MVDAAARRGTPRAPRRRMKRMIALVALVASLSTGCVVGRHGHFSVVAPPLLLAAAIAASARPGYVWVEGHWDWYDDHWVWSEGYWVNEEPGSLWVQGVWLTVEGGYSWRPGHWQATGPPGRVHDRR